MRSSLSCYQFKIDCYNIGKPHGNQKAKPCINFKKMEKKI